MATFLMDGIEHDTEVETCDCLGDPCPWCSTRRHRQPVHGGIWQLCPICNKDQIDALICRTLRPEKIHDPS